MKLTTSCFGYEVKKLGTRFHHNYCYCCSFLLKININLSIFKLEREIKYLNRPKRRIEKKNSA